MRRVLGAPAGRQQRAQGGNGAALAFSSAVGPDRRARVRSQRHSTCQDSEEPYSQKAPRGSKEEFRIARGAHFRSDEPRDEECDDSDRAGQ